MGAAAVLEHRVHYTPVPLSGLAGAAALPFPLYLRTRPDTWVLYRDLHGHLGHDQIERLLDEGVRQLFIRGSDREAYLHRIEASLDDLLKDRSVPIEARADVLHGVAVRVATEILSGAIGTAGIRRAQRLLVNTSGLVLRETKAFAALRALLGASRSLAQHSVTVGFLSMGLARHVLSADPGVLMIAGLAGLFHDVGRVGYEQLEHDPEHAQRGSALLQRLGLPEAVAAAALCHHERWDGTGFPHGLHGAAIPEAARVVGLVDVFDKVYSGQLPRVGVYDALQIMAQAYRGCFEDRLTASLVKLFR